MISAFSISTYRHPRMTEPVNLQKIKDNVIIRTMRVLIENIIYFRVITMDMSALIRTVS